MVRLVSPWPWVAHPVSCLILATIRPVQTRFRFGFGCLSLNLATKINSQAHSPRGTPSGLTVRTRVSPEHQPTIALRLLVSGWFQVLFHSPHRGTFHLSLTVLVHYRSVCVFSLGGWTPQLPTGLACPVVLRYLARVNPFSPTGLLPALVGCPTPFGSPVLFSTRIRQALQPRPRKRERFGLLPFRSPLLWEYSLFLWVLRCFSSPGSLLVPMCSARDLLGLPGGVSPFGHLRIDGCSRLPEAFRSVPRPSSAHTA